MKRPIGKLLISGRDVWRILEQHGFQMVRQRGSHIVMQRRSEWGTITVPVPDHSEFRLGTLQSIILDLVLKLEKLKNGADVGEKILDVADEMLLNVVGITLQFLKIQG